MLDWVRLWMGGTRLRMVLGGLSAWFEQLSMLLLDDNDRKQTQYAV